jgi:RHS repeat-associated protein
MVAVGVARHRGPKGECAASDCTPSGRTSHLGIRYTWDVRNRLSEVTTRATAAGPATSIVDYLYDAENRWIGENIDSTGDDQIDHEIRFAYDGDQIVLEFDKDLSAGSSSGATCSASAMTASDLSHRYLWGPTVDQLLADEQLLPSTASGRGAGGEDGYDLSQPGNLVWALTDNQNTVRDLAVYNAQTGATSIIDHRQFDSYGNLLSQTNPATGNASAVDCLFGYTGKPFDNATGLQNNLNRWFNPTTGRWMTQDPTGFTAGDLNLYRYVGNEPSKRVDSDGLNWVVWGSGHTYITVDVHDKSGNVIGTLTADFGPASGSLATVIFWYAPGIVNVYYASGGRVKNGHASCASNDNAIADRILASMGSTRKSLDAAIAAGKPFNYFGRASAYWGLYSALFCNCWDYAHYMAWGAARYDGIGPPYPY